MHRANEPGINKTSTSDRLDHCWQLGFQWHRRGMELVFKPLDCFAMRLFHSATILLLICIFSLKLHQADYQAEEGFFYLDLVGEHSAPMYLLLALYTDISAFCFAIFFFYFIGQAESFEIVKQEAMHMLGIRPAGSPEATAGQTRVALSP